MEHWGFPERDKNFPSAFYPNSNTLFWGFSSEILKVIRKETDMSAVSYM